MLQKSALRKTISEVLEEHEVEDSALEEGLVDGVIRDFGEDVYDDEDSEETSPSE